MRVVSNTSPISNLAIIGRVHLLRERYACVVIPSAVRAELLGLTHPAGRGAIEAALRDGWLIEESLPVQRVLPELCSSLDPGEAEAIALAASTATAVLLLDERRGRLGRPPAWHRRGRSPRRIAPRQNSRAHSSRAC